MTFGTTILNTEMKLLMVNYEYPPIGGGTAKACKKVVENRPDNIDIHLLTSSPSSYKKSEEEGLTVERLDVGKKNDHEWKIPEVLLFTLKASLKTRYLLRHEDFDFIHAWTGFPCGLVARIADAPYMVTLRGGDVPGFDSRYTNFYPFLKPLITNIWHNSEKVVANSSGLKKLAQSSSDIQIDVIPNGIDTERFIKDREYQKDPDKLRLITVCRLSEMKRVSDTIKATQNHENITLDILGSGSQREELERLVKELKPDSQINFVGHVDNKEVPDYLNNSDIFVLPSLNEGMSNAILEALAAGLPVITTEVGGTEELLDGNGFIVDKKSPKMIERCIEEYIDKPGLLEEHGKRSIQIAETKDWKTISERFYQNYLKLAKQEMCMAE